MAGKNAKRRREAIQRQRNKAVRNRAGNSKPPSAPPQVVDGPSTFAEMCTQVKSKVFSITRIRPIHGTTKSHFTTLGTGFLAGPGRFITCSHVMDNKDESHTDGDKYLLIQKDEFGKFYRDVVELVLGESLFTYPDKDVAIVYLPESFYMQGDVYLRDPNDHLILSNRHKPIGTEVGVFGYPLQTVIVNNNEIDMDDISIRVDKGILNSGREIDGVQVNEFTMAFNPGNSGGPIIDCATGEVIAFVESYTSIPIRFAKDQIPASQQEELGAEFAITAVRALYSRGFCTTNLRDISSEHSLILG